MEPRISIVTLGVDDLDRATTFYHDGLDLPIADASNDDITFLDLHATTLALYPRDALADDATVDPDGTGFPGITLAHNTRTRDDVDDLIDTAEAAGAHIVKPPEETFWGGYSGYFADPDDHLWEIAHNPNYEIPEEATR